MKCEKKWKKNDRQNFQKSNRAKAIEHYNKFLDRWKDADPSIAEVEDVKKRVAGLKEQTLGLKTDFTVYI